MSCVVSPGDVHHRDEVSACSLLVVVDYPTRLLGRGHHLAMLDGKRCSLFCAARGAVCVCVRAMLALATTRDARLRVWPPECLGTDPSTGVTHYDSHAPHMLWDPAYAPTLDPMDPT